jgi:tRNA-dihydrouridine synthase A
MTLDRRISIAPMMNCTDRHDRYFLRLIAPHVLLYSEMITTKALIYGDVDRHLKFHSAEQPLALQLGGSNPQELAHSAKLGESYGYNEINLNVGCPSDRVQSGLFGACLMLQPDLVAEGIAAMVSAVKIPVTVKCRIGVDLQDSYESLSSFINKIQQAGCKIFIIHARKAWLKGLSPKENREVPPLQYAVVRQIKQDFPGLTIIINGGIKTLAKIDEHLTTVDGVMIGREAYTNPYFLAEIEQKYYTENAMISREAIIEKLIPYAAEQLANGVRLTSITRHILGLFKKQKGAKIWRRILTEQGGKPGSGIEVLEKALQLCAEIN